MTANTIGLPVRVYDYGEDLDDLVDANDVIFCSVPHEVSGIIAAALNGKALQPFAGLSLEVVQQACAARNVEWHGDDQPDVLFRAIEMGGEAGEALNVVKKLARERMGAPGSRATVADLADELADVVICAANLANAEGIDLAAALARKFNATSDKLGLQMKLTASAVLGVGGR